ncbi:MAG: hypothetical protein KDD39_12695 [Bdellovibrionales bacterium]|nr:hypothetical protein [Bdellovibrionales bacterium]
MEPILHVIEGPFTYVVIAEVSIICALFLALVYLIVKRTLQPIEGYSGVAGLPSAVPVVQETTEKEDQVRANAGSKGVAEPTEEELLQKGYPDVPTYYAFKDKIKYLESKLLEYEILQEEIGTLSGLKMENEHLKNKLDSIEKQMAEAQAAPTPPAAKEPPAKKAVPEAPPAEVPANVEKKAHSSEADLVRESDDADKRQQKPADPIAVFVKPSESPKTTETAPATTPEKEVAAESKVETKPEVAAKEEVEIKAETKIEEKVETKAETKAEVKSSAKEAPSKAKPKAKNKTKAKASKKEKEPDAKMDSGTAVESTDLEPTLPGKSEKHADQGEPTAIGGTSSKVEAAPEPNDEPPSIADQPDGSPVIDGLIEQLDQLTQEKKAEKDKKKAG